VLVLLLGLAVELTSLIASASLTGQIIEALNKKAIAAEEKAGQAEVRATTLQRDAAILLKQAEDERLARVRLESKVAWRSIDGEKQHQMSMRLAKFAGQPALVAYNVGGAEEGAFARDVAALLKRSNWKVFEPLATQTLREGPLPFGANPPPSTGVEVWSTPDEQSTAAARLLIQELAAQGFDAKLSADAAILLHIQPTLTRVAVSIEHKPEGAQGEYKLNGQGTKK
jgi:hypothetical protein